MSRMRRFGQAATRLSLTAALVWTAVACGHGATQSGAAPATSVDVAARAQLPAAVRQSGVLTVATSYQWPPFDYLTSDGRPTGIDIQLVTDIASTLGLTPRFTNLQFPSIVPSVSDGRFDIGVNELADIPARRQVVQFVDYYDSALSVLVRKGTVGITAATLCGHTLALTQGSSQVAVAQTLSQQCIARGQPPIQFQFYPDSAVTILAVTNGRADAFLTDEAVGIYTSRTSAKNLMVLPGSVPNTKELSGIIVARNDVALAKAIQMALQRLINDGTYLKVLKAYGVVDAAVPRATIDGGGTV
jgi:polar amino acid transport system substrate-binding protein